MDLNKTEGIFGALSSVSAFFGNISHVIQLLLAWLASVGLTGTVGYVVVGILFLIAFLAVLKFIVLVTKLLIVGLVVWVLLSLIGII